MSMLLVVLLLGLSACGSSSPAAGQDSQVPQETAADAQETESLDQEEEDGRDRSAGASCAGEHRNGKCSR